MSNLDAWKALSTFEMDLPSGTHVKGRFIDMEDAIMGGGFDFSVLEGLGGKAKSNGKAVDKDAVAEGLRYKRFVVKSCLLEIGGEPLKEPLTDEDYALIPDPDRTAFFQHATRITVPLEV